MAEIMLARLQVTKAFATIVEYRIVPADVSTRRKLLDLRPSKSTAPKAMNRTEKMVAFAERMTKLLRRWAKKGECEGESEEVGENCLRKLDTEKFEDARIGRKCAASKSNIRRREMAWMEPEEGARAPERRAAAEAGKMHMVAREAEVL
ncbi:hypothetical protein HPP92_009983 [Vanilla planifolia]|uniref:Uncharacterized protein n=1 Tax=Vanilla planifolia TaxID=51239 RepID=A0A835UZN5_VANPL|nr:hypothetical protein HPP92_009983 [Vanilla planifolia]